MTNGDPVGVGMAAMSLIGTEQTSKHVRSDVRVRGQSGHQMLEVSFSAYDPERTSYRCT
jgi:hypothetical protein